MTSITKYCMHKMSRVIRLDLTWPRSLVLFISGIPLVPSAATTMLTAFCLHSTDSPSLGSPFGVTCSSCSSSYISCGSTGASGKISLTLFSRVFPFVHSALSPVADASALACGSSRLMYISIVGVLDASTVEVWCEWVAMQYCD